MKFFANFNLTQWLMFLENRHSQVIHLGLGRIEQVAKRMELLNPRATVITVGGTNGKGSTVAALEAIYSAAGYQVGAYSSPHLIRFNERIRVNQKEISDACLCQLFCNIELARQDIFLSYFEMVTLAALSYFKDHDLDLIILEVGMGGRLDATNIIASDLPIITTIDYDHQEYLGSTREEIAVEKAGILRQNRPFIYADRSPPTTLLSEARRLKTSGWFLGEAYDYDIVQQELILKFPKKFAKKLSFSLPRQAFHPNSLAASIIATEILQAHLPIKSHSIQVGLSHLFLRGRLELHSGEISYLFDVAHNPQGVKYLSDFLTKGLAYKHIYAVFSALKDKDILALIKPLSSKITAWFTASVASSRSLSQDELFHYFSLCSISEMKYYSHPQLAFNAACEQATAGDLILVYGSFLTVGEILSDFSNQQKSKNLLKEKDEILK